ncbi:MAG: carbohydrate binding domain-containing protein, partial [Nanoarchaeota archaeon]
MRNKAVLFPVITLLVLMVLLVSCAPITSPASKQNFAGEAVYAGCSSRVKCAAGYSCVANRCVPKSCRQNTDCPQNLVCTKNICALPSKPAVTGASSCTDDFSGQIAGKELWSLDFEGLNEDAWVSGWTKPHIQAANTKLALFELDDTIKHSGSRSLKISAPDATYSGVMSLITGAVGVQPGTEYTLSFWVKGQGLVSTTGHTAIVQKTAKELPDGGLSQSNSVYWFTLFPTSTYDWQHVVQTFTVPLGQDAMWVSILFQDGAGTVWLDDVEVMPSQIYNSLPPTSFTVHTKTPELGAVSHHYFLRDQPIQVSAILHNRNALPGNYDIKTSLNYCGSSIQQAAKSIQINPDEHKTTDLLTVDPSALEVGDYMLNVTLE